MADYVDNILTIKCNDINLKNKIKTLILSKDNENKLTFTMGKMLPIPEGFSDPTGWNDFGSDWANAVWGAYWVRSYNISESAHIISIYYETPWTPNLLWVKTLCRLIDSVSKIYKYSSQNEVRKEISVTHTYYDEYEGLGTKIE